MLQRLAAVRSPLAMRLPVLLLSFLLFSFLPGGAPDLAADGAALLALRAAVGRSVLKWNATASPCSWRGVFCSGGRVVALRLPGAGLLGAIPSGALTNLTALRALSLRLNALSGALPSDLTSLKNLRTVFLRGNRLSGELPASLFSLSGLTRLDLAANNFSGGISPRFNNLARLRSLLLEENQLSGEMPDLNLTGLVLFNVSYNKLNGSVPRGLRSMPAAAFLGMQLCGGPLQPCSTVTPPSPSPSPTQSSPSTKPAIAGGGQGESKKSSKLSGGAIAGIAVGSAAGLLILIALLIILCRKGSGGSRTRSAEHVTASAAVTAAPKPAAGAAAAVAAGAKAERGLVFLGGREEEFDLEQLLRASAEVLGKGAYGTAYKAVLEGGLTVAVKRLRDVNLEEAEFRDRIEAVGAIDHQNVVSLKAYYYSKDEKLLVFDYMPGGSLSALLHGNRGLGHNPLDWRRRCSIALAAAHGIKYIHSIGTVSSHGNIKSSNILLDKSYEARVSDHGLAVLVGATTPNRNTGYCAPDVTDAQKVSQMADVYSFGVILLELLAGKAPTQALDLSKWVQSVAPEEWKAEVFDPELLRQEGVEEYMSQLLQLAMDCVAQYPFGRPSISEVISRIEQIHEFSPGRTRDRVQHLESNSVDNADDQSSRRTESIDESRPQRADS